MADVASDLLLVIHYERETAPLCKQK